MTNPIMFDLDTMVRVLTDAPVHLYEGTCELCGNRGKALSDVGGCLLCDKCRNTLAYNIKETNHPFTHVRATMDPKLRGQGPPGEKRLLVPATSLQLARHLFLARLRELREQREILSPRSIPSSATERILSRRTF